MPSINRVSKRPGTSDERLAREVFLLARPLAHEHQVGVRITRSEHDLRSRVRERTARALERKAFELRKRSRRRGIEQ